MQNGEGKQGGGIHVHKEGAGRTDRKGAEEVQEVQGERPVIYIKAEQSTYLSKPDVTIGDFCSVYCSDRLLEQKIRSYVVHRFEKEEEGRAFLSVMVLIQAISEIVPAGEVRNVGEQDAVLYYRPCRPSEKRKDFWLQKGKIAFVCVSCFLGMGISIMGYNNDVDMSRVFAQLYETFFGTKPDGPTFVELFYSIGLTAGIFLFFDHRPGKRVTNEPTPVQVQMRLYEQQVNQTFILGASRKGEELDVRP